MANEASSTYKSLKNNIKNLNNNNYTPKETSFYDDGLSVNKNGNVYITKNSMPIKKINKKINERR